MISLIAAVLGLGAIQHYGSDALPESAGEAAAFYEDRRDIDLVYYGLAYDNRHRELLTIALRSEDGAPGIRMALREALRDRLRNSRNREDRELYWLATRQLIQDAIETGVHELALPVYVEFAAHRERDFWHAPSLAFGQRYDLRVEDSGDGYGGPQFDEDNAAIAIALAAYAVQEGDRGLTQTMLAQAETSLSLAGGLTYYRRCDDSELGFGGDQILRTGSDLNRAIFVDFRASPEWRFEGIRTEIAFLREYLNPQLTVDEAFDMAALGRPAHDALETVQELERRLQEIDDGARLGLREERMRHAWLSDSLHLNNPAEVIDALKRDYFEARGLGNVFAVLAPHFPCESENFVPIALPEHLDRRPLITRARQIDTLRSLACRYVSIGSGLVHEAEPAELPERPLSITEHQLWEAEDLPVLDPEGRIPPNGLPEDGEAPGLVQFDGREWTAVYRSRVLEGYSSYQGGYWIVRTENGGTRWGRPYYLGLPYMSPYVVEPYGDLPLFVDGVVRIPVRVQSQQWMPLDYPPLDRRVSHRAALFFIEFSWDELSRDSDGDGLTDIEEHRLGLDLFASDTDGDGLEDGVDPLPNLRPEVPFDPSFALALLAPMLGSDVNHLFDGSQPRGLIELIRASQAGEIESDEAVLPVFASGADVLSRIVSPSAPIRFQTPEFHQAMARQYGDRVPFQILAFVESPTGNRWLVEWRTEFRGGYFVIVHTDDGFDFIDAGSWIS
ncbi:MAG: hypothetical protein GC208_05565 [Alphaproteobacteria bacterium]|nr:hypothetical protein [Alphaproteobacteria bacterium]